MKDDIIVYGADWCGDCRRAKRFLVEHDIDYHWVDVDQDRKAAALVRKLNKGNRVVPTIIFPDGSKLVEPSNRELAAKLNIAVDG